MRSHAPLDKAPLDKHGDGAASPVIQPAEPKLAALGLATPEFTASRLAVRQPAVYRLAVGGPATPGLPPRWLFARGLRFPARRLGPVIYIP